MEPPDALLLNENMLQRSLCIAIDISTQWRMQDFLFKYFVLQLDAGNDAAPGSAPGGGGGGGGGVRLRHCSLKKSSQYPGHGVGVS